MSIFFVKSVAATLSAAHSDNNLNTMSTNPLLDGLTFAREPGSFALYIFGATGDLTRKKLIPALFSLFTKGIISHFRIIGFARRPWTREFFQNEARSMLDHGPARAASTAVKDAFLEKLDYISSTFDNPEGYAQIEAAAQGMEGRIFYLSTPPNEYPAIIENLGRAGHHHAPPGGYSRIIVEKPIGRDLASAKELNTQLAAWFDESQIYRIDHYLGKETVQNLLVLRFCNNIFEPLWNNHFVDHIQITIAESIGVGTRGNYYESSGALRDMIQNHAFQLLTLLTMEHPGELSAEAIRSEKVKILKSLRPITFREVNRYTVRAQYSQGVIEGEEVPGYRQENGVAPDSMTETYVALELGIDNWRWAGVPIYVRTGKRLSRKSTEIAVYFKEPPHQLFRTGGQLPPPNSLIIHIQPEEGISWNVNSKVPGYITTVRPVNMDFAYGSAFGDTTPEAYERLLLDCMVGDSTLYTRRDEVETSWAFITRILQGWSQNQTPMASYPAGSAGPEDAKALLNHRGKKWRKL